MQRRFSVWVCSSLASSSVHHAPTDRRPQLEFHAWSQYCCQHRHYHSSSHRPELFSCIAFWDLEYSVSSRFSTTSTLQLLIWLGMKPVISYVSDHWNCYYTCNNSAKKKATAYRNIGRPLRVMEGISPLILLHYLAILLCLVTILLHSLSLLLQYLAMLLG